MVPGPSRVPAIGKSLFRCCFCVREQSFSSIDSFGRAVFPPEGTNARLIPKGRKESKRNFAEYLLYPCVSYAGRGRKPFLMALINPRNVSSRIFLPFPARFYLPSPPIRPPHVPPPFDAATNCFKARDTDSTDRLRLISLVPPPLLTHPPILFLVRSSCSCSRHFPLFRSPPPPALILLTRRRSAELRGWKRARRKGNGSDDDLSARGRDYEQSRV